MTSKDDLFEPEICYDCEGFKTWPRGMNDPELNGKTQCKCPPKSQAKCRICSGPHYHVLLMEGPDGFNYWTADATVAGLNMKAGHVCVGVACRPPAGWPEDWPENPTVDLFARRLNALCKAFGATLSVDMEGFYHLAEVSVGDARVSYLNVGGESPTYSVGPDGGYKDLKHPKVPIGPLACVVCGKQGGHNDLPCPRLIVT